MRTAFVALAICTAFFGCANPSITNIQSGLIRESKNPRIYLARFEGRPDFVEEATDMFVAHLQGTLKHGVIQGDSIRPEGSQISSGGNIAPYELALKKARAAKAGYVIVGKVTSHHTGGMLNGFVTVRIIDTGSGRVVGTVHRPSGLLIGYSEHQCVMAASRRAAEGLAAAL